MTAASIDHDRTLIDWLTITHGSLAVGDNPTGGYRESLRLARTARRFSERERPETTERD